MWVGRSGWGGWWGEWTAAGRLKHPLGLFELAMSPRSASCRPKHAQRAIETSHYHWGEFQTHVFHVVPFMGLTASVVNLHGLKNSL